jgi:hypothetical protein
MSGKHRSIGERLDRAHSPEARRETLSAWIDNWEGDHRMTLDELRQAIQSGNPHGIASGIASMRAIADKRFGALRRILLDDAGPAREGSE